MENLIFYGTYILHSLIFIVLILLSVAFYTLLERKIISAMQRRMGPNIVGPFGLFQAFADALKLLTKKTILPSNANSFIFIVGPLITFCFGLLSWTVIPLGKEAVFLNSSMSILYILAFSSLSLYGLIISGWASNSKYAFFGTVRAIAQMISYEVSLGLMIISVACTAGTLNLSGIVMAQINVWYCFPHFPIFVLFFIAALAETNRHPFDFAEAESELVSGYNTEYGSVAFVLFFLAEYAAMILMSTLISLLFLGGWFAPFNYYPGGSIVFLIIKILIMMTLFVLVRASYPRCRYDQLMEFCWKFTLPITLAWFIFTVFVLNGLNGFPPIGGPLSSFDFFI